MNVYEGNISGKRFRFGIVVSRFNEFITSKLLSGALDALKRHETPEDNIAVAWVPGAFEIPIVAKKLAETKKFHAIICLGAVIRGETPHYDYICNEVSKGVAQVALQTDVPTIFGVLTTLVNFVVFWLMNKLLGEELALFNNAVAFVVAVAFAYITNKLFVFESKDMSRTVFMSELCKFVIARLSTGLIDLIIMYITVDVMAWNAAVWKVISNIIVIIGNYLLSKFVVFRKCKDE